MSSLRQLTRHRPTIQIVHQLCRGLLIKPEVAKNLDRRSPVVPDLLIDCQTLGNLGRVGHTVHDQTNGKTILDALSTALAMV